MRDKKATVITIIILFCLLYSTFLLYNYCFPEKEVSEANQVMDKETKDKLIKKYHLDKPKKSIPNIFNGDFGTSFK